MTKYDPEAHWSNVAQKIRKRGEYSYVAGDDNPFTLYYRQKCLTKFLDSVDFCSKRVLEIGCGPGGNLDYLAKRCGPQKLLGVDISQTMIDVAVENLAHYGGAIELYKINGIILPFETYSIDVSFTVTCLQHIIDEAALVSLISEICRVTKTEVMIIELTANKKPKAGGNWVSRRIDTYKSLFAENGFALRNVSFLNTGISQLWAYFFIEMIYKRLVNKQHVEGDPISPVFKFALGWSLFFTRRLDDLFALREDLTMMSFQR